MPLRALQGDPDSLFSLTALPGRGLAPEIAAPGAEELEALEASSDDDEVRCQVHIHPCASHTRLT